MDKTTKKEIEKAINHFTHSIVDLLDQIEIYREKRKLLLEKQKEMIEKEHEEMVNSLKKVRIIK